MEPSRLLSEREKTYVDAAVNAGSMHLERVEKKQQARQLTVVLSFGLRPPRSGFSSPRREDSRSAEGGSGGD